MLATPLHKTRFCRALTFCVCVSLFAVISVYTVLKYLVMERCGVNGEKKEKGAKSK